MVSKKISRRSLLMGAGTLALGQLVGGCGGQAGSALRVRLLARTFPAQLLREFQRQLERRTPLDFAPVGQLAELFELLQTWHQAAADPEPSQWRLPFSVPFVASPPSPVADLVTLGDAWLVAAIQQNLIQPMNLENLAGWEQLPESWQAFVRRDRQGAIDPEGDLWAAPYRWGTVVIAYRTEQFRELGWTPTDWEDLWRPELQGHVSLPDSPRTVMGLAAKRLGYSVNEENLAERPDLAAALTDLHRQVRFYSSDNYLQPLLLGDTWVAVGWSTDILPVLQRDRRIAAIVPASGTILTADTWVRPADADPATAATLPPLAAQWIEFCWQQQIATQLSVIGTGASPILIDRNRAELPNALQENALLLPDAEILNQSEFLLPLPAAAVSQYDQWWTTLRQTGSIAL